MNAVNNNYKKIDWSDTPVYEDKLNTNNNKLDISLEEAKILYSHFLNKDVLVNGTVK